MQHGLVTKLTYPGSLVDSFCEVQVPLQQKAYASGATHIHPVIAMEANMLKNIYTQCSGKDWLKEFENSPKKMQKLIG